MLEKRQTILKPGTGSGIKPLRAARIRGTLYSLLNFVAYDPNQFNFFITKKICLIQSKNLFRLTNNLLSTVLTTISSGSYWLTSNRSFNILLSPSSWINGELMLSTQPPPGVAPVSRLGGNSPWFEVIVFWELKIKNDILILKIWLKIWYHGVSAPYHAYKKEKTRCSIVK